MSGERPIARWQKLAALALLAASIALLAVFNARLGPDFWPLDASRVGPNLVAAVVQAAVVFVALVVLWPPWRRRVHRLLDSKLAPLHEHLEHLHARHEAHTAHLERVGHSLIEVHEKLDRLTEKEPE